MTPSLDVNRIGPPTATLVHPVKAGGRDAVLAVLVEVWGAGTHRAAIEQRLAAGIAAVFDRRSGGTTARLKAALAAGDHWLAKLKAEAGPEGGRAGIGAGASVLLATDTETILAQAGPAVAYVLAPDRDAAGRASATRYPTTSPWLRRGIEVLVDDPLWPPLGLGNLETGARHGGPPRDTEVHWFRWPSAPGVVVLLAASKAAAHLPRDVVARLLATPPGEIVAATQGVLPEDAPALWLMLPERRAPARPGPAQPLTRTAPPIGAGEMLRTAGRAGRAGRLWSARAARFGARVMVGLLPNRAEGGAGGYRAEGMRFAAALALGLPLAVVGLALLMRARAMEGALPAIPAPTSLPTAPGVGAIPEGQAKIKRLTDSLPIARLPGAADDRRRLVVAAGVPYVLNAALDRVDRVDGGSAQTVLFQGQAVGATVVGALADLFQIPPAAGRTGEHVMALDEAGRLWSLGAAGVAGVARAETPAWIGIGAVAGFEGRLYALDRSTGQIYRYEPDAGAFPSFAAAGGEWLAEPGPFADAIDLAVDGAAYVLFRDGRIAKYDAGAQVSFPVAGLDTPIAGAETLYTSASAGRVLVADRGNGRVVVFAPDGAFESQLLRPAQPMADPPDDGRFTALHDLWWDEPNGLLYVAAGDALHRATYR